MKRSPVLLASILTLTIVLSACGAGGAMTDNGSTDYGGVQAPSSAYDKGGVVSEESGGYEDPDSIYANEDNKIIRTAELTIQTIEFDAAVAALNALTQAQGGYYETAEVNGGGYYDTWASRSGYYVVRVPKENFTAFRDGAGGIGHIYSSSENSQNVGETYYDTEARLAALNTKRDRLLALLEKAEKMEDIITLENALAEVQYEIDMHTAALRKYDSLIDYATFRIRLNEVVKLTEEPGAKESFGSRFVSSLRAGLEDFGQAAQDLALWLARHLIGVVVFAVIAAAAVMAGRRLIRRRRGKKAE